ncbi:MAG: MobA/MobL family protein [Sulfitobacter geojensis]
MKHLACHFSVLTLSRGKTAGAVARAAYIGRCRLHDERTGKTFSYGHLSGLLAEGTVNWVTGSDRLWNEVEAAETRKNSRVAREIRVALPAELPLDEMRRLIHGFSCNLKDRYGVVAQYAIHAPKFHDKEDGTDVARKYREGILNLDEYLHIMSDPMRTNLNFHAHILVSTREKDEVHGGFGAKVRCLDNIKTGPEEIQTMRAEWETRTNAALGRIGSEARVDLRSYKEMVNTGDAPEGLVPQKHLGPKASNAMEKARVEDKQAIHQKQSPVENADRPPGIKELFGTRQMEKKHNNAIWASWLLLRDLERKKARLEESQRIATEREAVRKKAAAKEKAQIRAARCDQDAHQAATETVNMASPRGGLADIIARVQRGEKMVMPEGDITIDPETYLRPASTTPFEEPIRVRRLSRTQVRTRSR